MWKVNHAKGSHYCILCEQTDKVGDRHTHKLYPFHSEAGKERFLKVKLESILGDKLLIDSNCALCLYHIRKVECLWNGVSAL